MKTSPELTAFIVFCLTFLLTIFCTFIYVKWCALHKVEKNDDWIKEKFERLGREIDLLQRQQEKDFKRLLKITNQDYELIKLEINDLKSKK